MSWELITIFHEYGLPLWTICLFLCLAVKVSVSCDVDNFAIVFYDQAYKFKLECVSCPYSHLLSWMNGQMPLREAIARVTAQIFGGMFFFWIQCHIWDFGLTKIHLGRSKDLVNLSAQGDENIMLFTAKGCMLGKKVIK